MISAVPSQLLTYQTSGKGSVTRAVKEKHNFVPMILALITLDLMPTAIPQQMAIACLKQQGKDIGNLQ